MSTIYKLPPFITDGFVLKVIIDMGGTVTDTQIKEHIQTSWDDRDWKLNRKGVHAMQYIKTQLNSLTSAGYFITKRDKKTGELIYQITEDAKAPAQRMAAEWWAKWGKSLA